MTFRIPQDGKFSQPNRGDIGGNLNSSLNLDLRTNEGRMRVSPRLKVLTNDASANITDANFGVPIRFLPVEVTGAAVNMLAITGVGTGSTDGSGRVFANSGNDYSVFADLAGSYATNQPSNIHFSQSDAVYWNQAGDTADGDVYISTMDTLANNIDKLNTSGPAWVNDWFTTATGSGGAGGSFLTNNLLVNMEVGFNNNLYITNGDRVINVQSSDGFADLTGAGTVDFGGSLRPIWIRSTSNRLWICLASWINNASNIREDGFIAEWDATGTAVNKLHKINAPLALTGIVYNDVLYILDAYGILKKFNGSGFYEVARLPVANTNIEMPGIRQALYNNRWVHHRGMEMVNGRINILVNNFVSTGVYVDNMPSGVWEFDPENPSLGLYHKNSPCADTTDWGQQAVESVGAIAPLKKSAGNYLAGISYYTDDATTNRKAVFYDDISTNTNKRGSFVTPFLSSSDIEDTFQFAHYRHSPIPSGDKIVGKYRTKKSSLFPFTASCTWTSTTTFTSTDSDFANVVGGEEVEPIMGAGASTTAHVNSISNNAGTYTITLDDAIGQASGTFKARVNNWKKLSTLDVAGDTNGRMMIGDEDTKVQIKTEIRATGDFELDDLTVANKSYKKAN